MKKNRLMDDAGFTLVELTIVMVIVSVLAAIAIPVMQNQRQKSYKSVMTADLHSIVVSELAYSSENNDAFTTDLTALGSEGYKASSATVAHIKVTGGTYVACTKHSSYSGGWTTYDSTTGSMTSGTPDCG